MARRQRRAHDGGQFAPAERRGDRQRVGEAGRVSRKSAVDRRLLACQAEVVDARAAAGPTRAAAAEQRRGDRGGRRGIPDSHLAETNEVRPRRDHLVADVDRGQECAFVHRRRLREVRRGLFERKRNHLQPGPCRARELVDRGAAGGEVRHHLRGHLGGIGGYALRRDAVIAREHEHVDMIEPRHATSLPLRQPPDDVFEPSQAAGRLGQLALTLERDRRGFEVAWRQVETCCPQIFERGKGARAGRDAVDERWPRRHAAIFLDRQDIKSKRVSSSAVKVAPPYHDAW